MNDLFDSPFPVETIDEDGVITTHEPAVSAPDATQLAVIQSIKAVQGALAQLDAINVGIDAIAKDFPADLAIQAINTGKGMKEAIAGRAAWRDPRIATEKARKAAKAPVLTLGRDIDARAEYITGRLADGERNYDEQIKAEETRAEEVKRQAAAAEAARVAKHEAGINTIRGYLAKAQGLSSERIASGMQVIRDSAESIGPAWEEFQDRARAACAETLEALSELHTKTLAAESEAKRQEELRAENARVAAELAAQRKAMDDERAELKRQADAIAADQARIAKAAESAPIIETVHHVEAVQLAPALPPAQPALFVPPTKQVSGSTSVVQQQVETIETVSPVYALLVHIDTVPANARLSKDMRDWLDKLLALAGKVER